MYVNAKAELVTLAPGAPLARGLKHVSKKFEIVDKVEKLKKREAFISLKYHKKNFDNSPRCRLINPAKSDSGTLSKTILDRINSELRNVLKLNQ